MSGNGNWRTGRGSRPGPWGQIKEYLRQRFSTLMVDEVRRLFKVFLLLSFLSFYFLSFFFIFIFYPFFFLFFFFFFFFFFLLILFAYLSLVHGIFYFLFLFFYLSLFIYVAWYASELFRILCPACRCAELANQMRNSKQYKKGKLVTILTPALLPFSPTPPPLFPIPPSSPILCSCYYPLPSIPFPPSPPHTPPTPLHVRSS